MRRKILRLDILATDACVHPHISLILSYLPISLLSLIPVLFSAPLLPSFFLCLLCSPTLSLIIDPYVSLCFRCSLFFGLKSAIWVSLLEFL